MFWVKSGLKAKIKYLLNYWLPPVIWAVVIFLFSSRPSVQTFGIYWQDFVVKKLAHMSEYAFLAILLYRALRKNNLPQKKAIFVAVLIAVVYAASDEFHQSFVPGREPRLRDVGFDTIGASLAMYFVSSLLPKVSGKVKNWAQKLEII